MMEPRLMPFDISAARPPKRTWFQNARLCLEVAFDRIDALERRCAALEEEVKQQRAPAGHTVAYLPTSRYERDRRDAAHKLLLIETATIVAGKPNVRRSA
jgi:hypothetical protein